MHGHSFVAKQCSSGILHAVGPGCVERNHLQPIVFKLFI